jgi:type VI secretion system protein ImpJ
MADARAPMRGSNGRDPMEDAGRAGGCENGFGEDARACRRRRVMPWRSKVAWAEGLFLRPHHFQQNDRYHENALEARVRHATPYPWGFASLEIDADLLLQGRVGFRAAQGIMPDGLPFDIPADNNPPPAVSVPDNAASQGIWLTVPLAGANLREIDRPEEQSGSRFVLSSANLVDANASVRDAEDIHIAQPRFLIEIRSNPKPGHASLQIARILEIRDKAVILDGQFVPPILICAANASANGWIDRAIGWMETKVDELARYAADPTAGGGLQSADYLVLQILNRHVPALRHLRGSRYVHPERLFLVFLGIVGELSTFATQARRPGEYPAYDHDDLASCFAPLLRDMQEFLSLRFGRRAIRLEIVEKAPNAFVCMVPDKGLIQNANLVLEVSAKRPLTEIQLQFPQLFKVGPNTKMNEIVHTHLPGIPLTHLPTPPPQLRAMADHVYFLLDRNSPLWPEFSKASGIGMHFSDDWPNLGLNLWAVMGDRR